MKKSSPRLVRGDWVRNSSTHATRGFSIHIEYPLVFNWHFVLYIEPAIFLNDNVDYYVNPYLLLLNAKI